MTLDDNNPKIYWQVDGGEKHSIPDGATLFVKKTGGKGYISFALDEKGDVVFGKERKKIPAALMRLFNVVA